MNNYAVWSGDPRRLEPPDSSPMPASTPESCGPRHPRLARPNAHLIHLRTLSAEAEFSRLPGESLVEGQYALGADPLRRVQDAAVRELEVGAAPQAGQLED